MELATDDKLQIIEIIARYNYAADTRDVEATLAEYTEGGRIEGDFQTGEGKTAMREDLPKIFEMEGTLKRHLALNHRFESDGGETQPAVGATSLIRDEFLKADGKWLVRRHHVKIDPSLTMPG